MTSLLVMGMIIARAANGFPPELVLVSQPVLTYNANSVTIYYDVQNIGDYTYRGDVCLFLDPDDGYCYASEWVKVCPGRIKRIAISIPAYRPNPSWTYTVMPYYELGDELYSFTTFEYFEPVRFCWYGYRNEPWVVITVGPRIRYYTRPGDFRFYYDGYRPPMPPPPGHGPGHPHHMPPMDPHHHTYGYHHSNGGYPANYHPDHVVPGYNHNTDSNGGGATVHPHATGTPGSMSSNNASGNNGGSSSSSSSATVRPNNTSGSSSSNASSSSSSSSATVRPSGNNSGSSSSSVRPSGNNSGSSSSSARPSSNSSSSSSSSVRPSGNNSGSSSSSGRPSSSGNSNVSRPSSSSSSSSSGRTGTSSGSSRTSSSSSSSSSSGRSGNSSSSSSSRGSSSTGGRR